MAKKSAPMLPGQSLTGRKYIEKKTQQEKTRRALSKLKRKPKRP